MTSGVELLLPKLRSFIRRGGRVQVLFGEDFDLSESAALQHLFSSNVELHRFVDTVNFHPKVWLFQGENEFVGIVGSSNLSKPALTTNIEANVLVNDPTFVKTQINFFEELWDHYSEAVDQDWMNYWRDREEAEKVYPRYTSDGRVDHNASLRQIHNFVRSWQRYIRQPRRMGPRLEYWRGWYLAPEPATFDDAKMSELRNVLITIDRSSEYRTNRQVSLSPQYTDQVIRAANISFVGRPMARTSPRTRRDLFIRQHKNYLEKLGLINIIDRRGPAVKITQRGRRLIRAASLAARQRVFTEAAHDLRWKWARKLDMVEFVLRLLRSLPQKRIYYHEMSFFVIHAIHPTMYESIKRLAVMFRELPRRSKTRLIQQIETGLSRDLRGRGVRAFEHYQYKALELMRSFGYIRGIRFHEDPQHYGNCYLELA